MQKLFCFGSQINQIKRIIFFHKGYKGNKKRVCQKSIADFYKFVKNYPKLSKNLYIRQPYSEADRACTAKN